jgi:hypothetical protein
MKKKILKIKYVGKTHEAPEFLTDGNLLIELPKDQSRAFRHDHAARILKVAPESYKPVVQRLRR